MKPRLRFLQKSDIAAVRRLKLSNRLSLEFPQLLRRYIDYFLEGELKAGQLLDSLRKVDI